MRVRRASTWLGAALLVVSVAAPTRVLAQTVLYDLNGPSIGSMYGYSLTGLGDLDADGRSEFAVGSYGEGSGLNTGRVRVYAGHTGKQLVLLQGPSSADHYGEALAGGLDWNRDGVVDLVVGARTDLQNGTASGSVRVYSGATFAQLASFFGNSSGDLCGDSVAVVGDLDGDGCEELLVGLPGEDVTGAQAGQIKVYRGKTGALLYTKNGEAAINQLGRNVCGVGDVDLDGVPDFAATAPSGISWIKVWSGASGAELKKIAQPPALDWSVLELIGAGDLDADGRGDLLVGAPQCDIGAAATGQLRALSCVSGATLWTVAGAAGAACGASIARLGDWDGDGASDIVGGSPYDGAAQLGIARVYSGASGAVLHAHEGIGGHYGEGIGALGDVDGDGAIDFGVGAPDTGSALGVGRVIVHSRHDQALGASTHAISVSSGGVQSLALDAGAARAGDYYLVVGSLSGLSPTFTLGGLAIPFTSDAYTQYTLANPNHGPLVATFGVLDAQGRATARIVLGAGAYASAAGLVADHAFVTFDATLAPGVVSGAVALSCTP